MNGATSVQHRSSFSSHDFSQSEELVSESLLELGTSFQKDSKQINPASFAKPTLQHSPSTTPDSAFSSKNQSTSDEGDQTLPRKRKTRSQQVKYKEGEMNEENGDEEIPEEPLWVTGKRLSWCQEGEPCKNCQDYIFEGNKFHQACIYRPKTLKRTRKTKRKTSPRVKAEKSAELPSKLTIIIRNPKNNPSPSLHEQKEEATPSFATVGKWCICRSEDETSPMIACDTCTDWLHLRCVNLTQHEADNLPYYVCPTCRNSKDPEVRQLVADLLLQPKNADQQEQNNSPPSNEATGDKDSSKSPHTRSPKKENKKSSKEKKTQEKATITPKDIETLPSSSSSLSSNLLNTIECKRSYKYLAAIEKQILQFSSSATDSDDNFWS